ncbi:hypothetical protein BHE74_00018148 [Ensete ventricosum]|uniref:Uncharacterized protein n=1 Tax=Ensete ventricosum TaxID=4639 RepID=A0A427ARA6_ENSVE|nr:hypothetical protein B296_00026679 [Ensete ventricosum]RWW73946.1 hypothetical protein BHE74_00018148 [Ensete ventricosum]RZR77226.1 hypothetical protein BHM03_00002238 [Ensete ventricosum]
MPVFPTLKTHKETQNRIILQEIPTTSGDLASQFAETAPELRNNSKNLIGTLKSRDCRKKPANSTRRHEIDHASEWVLRGDEGLPWKDWRRDTLIHDEGVGILGHGRGSQVKAFQDQEPQCRGYCDPMGAETTPDLGNSSKISTVTLDLHETPGNRPGLRIKTHGTSKAKKGYRGRTGDGMP